MNLTLLLLSLALGCTGKPGDETGDTDSSPAGAAPGEALRGSTDREMAPATSDLSTLYTENADFSFDLLRTVQAAAPGNQVLSPWSLQVVMAQVRAGASGDARTAIDSTFRWTLADDALNASFDAADLAITAHNVEGETPVVITSTNQIFVTTGYPLGAAWLDTLSTWYGTGVQQMDFEADPAGVAADINTWIADRTGDRIKDLVSAGVVADSRMLLVNALYFKASWAIPFSESSTADQPFTIGDGTEVSVPTMSGSVTVSGAQADGYFIADIPYSDAGLTMTIVLPEAGRFDEVLAGLDSTTLQAAITSEAWCEECAVQFPKFELKGAPDITSALIALGMDPAFGGAYPGISDALTLTAVEQKGFVAVNEKGTEAAAATMAEFSDSASEPPFGPIVVDRPFIWLVREEPTGAVLFSGIVSDPR